MMRRTWLEGVRWLRVALGMGCMALFGLALASATDRAQQRELALAAQLRCLVCQNQSIAESNAPLAHDLRTQIREQIAAGKTDGQIVQFMTERYGDFVLYRPQLRPATALLWFGPVVFFALAALLIWRMRRGARQRASLESLTKGERERADRLLGGS